MYMRSTPRNIQGVRRTYFFHDQITEKGDRRRGSHWQIGTKTDYVAQLTVYNLLVGSDLARGAFKGKFFTMPWKMMRRRRRIEKEEKLSHFGRWSGE